MKATIVCRAKNTWDAHRLIGAWSRNLGLTFQYGSYGEVLVLVDEKSGMNHNFFYLMEALSTKFLGMLLSIEVRTSDGEFWTWDRVPRTTQEERNWLRCLCNEAWEGRAQELLLRVLNEADAADPHSTGV